MPITKSTNRAQLALWTCSLLYKDVHFRTDVNPRLELFTIIAGMEDHFAGRRTKLELRNRLEFGWRVKSESKKHADVSLIQRWSIEQVDMPAENVPVSHLRIQKDKRKHFEYLMFIKSIHGV
jgi:hypothetical protein